MYKKILLGAGLFALGALGAIWNTSKNKEEKMPQIGDRAPEFSAMSTKGEITFPQNYKGKWVVFFSHPADFTPVCTTEFMAFQNSLEKFKELNTELLGLSVDDVETHKMWINSIYEELEFKGVRNIQIDFPIIDDKDGEIAHKYGMLQKDYSDNKTVRAVFIIDPHSKIRAIIYYPQSCGRNIPEILRVVKSLQTTDQFNVATPADWVIGDDVIIPISEHVYLMSDKELKKERIICKDWYLCTKELSKTTIENEIKNENC